MARSSASPGTASNAATFSVLVAPLLLVAAAVANQIGEALVGDGQVDRAAFGWFVVAPLVLLSPGAAALTWQATGRRHVASRLIAGMSLVIGIGAVMSLVLTIAQIGCTPVHDPLQVVGPAFPTAFAAAAAFGLAGTVALVSVGIGGSSRTVVIRSLATGAIGLAIFGLAAILVFTATFAGVSCAAPQ